MTRIIQGVFDFQQRVFGAKRTLFERLHDGQRPLALFITCADSRINPNLLTQTEPGESFVRNAGTSSRPTALRPTVSGRPSTTRSGICTCGISSSAVTRSAEPCRAC